MARQMKDCGVEWIGPMPTGWCISKLKYHAELNPKCCTRVETTGYVTFTPMESIKKGYFIPRTERYSRFSNNSQYVEYEEGDIAFAKVTPCFENDNTCIMENLVSGKGFGSSELFIIRPFAIVRRYLFYLLQNPHFKAAGVASMTGTGGLKRVSSGAVRNYKFALPNDEIQRRITSYLDSKCAEIDKVVEQTRATIEEYKKLKQAIITEAVTKGVRGPRPMKPSGVEWIGDIPEEWNRSRVGLHYHVVLGKMLCNTQQNDTYTLEPYYCAADIHFGSVDTAKKKMWFSPEEKDTYRVMPGDLLVVEGGAGAGGCAIVKNGEAATYIQNSIMIVRGKSTCSVAYLGYWIESLVKRAYIDVVCNKATIPHFTKDKLSSVPIPLPSAEEQQEIATYIDAKCAEIDCIIEKKEQLIEELGSYKKSLIYEYVTGKKEVKTNMELKVPYSN